jgi:hypothetical protein
MNYNQTPPPYYGGYSGGVTVSDTNAIMKRVYVRMFIGLLVSAFCALGVASSYTAMSLIFGNQLIYWGMFIAMLVMAWVIPGRIDRMQTSTVLLLFILFSAMMGAFLAPIFLVYSIGSICYTFFITAGMFGAMSVYGYYTKSDLTKMGSYLMMALIGLIIASVVNIFAHSSGLEWIISIVGILIFVGLTAWDTQSIKRMAQANMEPQLADKLATIGAMNLYLDFVNIFLYLLRFLGNSRD